MNADTTTPATEIPANLIGKISQAAIFAREYAKDAAKEMLDALRVIGRRNKRITVIALGVSMPHQIAFLLALATPFLHWDTPVNWIESIALVSLAVLAPVGTDYYILNQITTVAARAAAKASKVYAMATMLIPVGVSGIINYQAPGPMIMKWLAVWMVTLIPLAEAGRALLRPDFVKIEEMETSVEAQLTRTVERLSAQVADETPVPAEGTDPKQVNKQRMLAAQKARELAMQAPDITIAALMRATSCGRGSAKKAIEQAKAARTESQVPVAV